MIAHLFHKNNISHLLTDRTFVIANPGFTIENDFIHFAPVKSDLVEEIYIQTLDLIGSGNGYSDVVFDHQTNKLLAVYQN